MTRRAIFRIFVVGTANLLFSLTIFAALRSADVPMLMALWHSAAISSGAQVFGAARRWARSAREGEQIRRWIRRHPQPMFTWPAPKGDGQ